MIHHRGLEVESQGMMWSLLRESGGQKKEQAHVVLVAVRADNARQTEPGIIAWDNGTLNAMKLPRSGRHTQSRSARTLVPPAGFE